MNDTEPDVQDGEFQSFVKQAVPLIRKLRAAEADHERKLAAIRSQLQQLQGLEEAALDRGLLDDSEHAQPVPRVDEEPTPSGAEDTNTFDSVEEQQPRQPALRVLRGVREVADVAIEVVRAHGTEMSYPQILSALRDRGFLVGDGSDEARLKTLAVYLSRDGRLIPGTKRGTRALPDGPRGEVTASTSTSP